MAKATNWQKERKKDKGKGHGEIARSERREGRACA